MKEIITIQISEYLTNELVDKIVNFQWGQNASKFYLRQDTYWKKTDSDCFRVIAITKDENVIGHLFCMRNEENPARWYYGDLCVHTDYRRLGIASQMVKAAFSRISDSGGEIVCCYVYPENTASINLQKSLGFEEKPPIPFEELYTENQLMFEKNVKLGYGILKIDQQDAAFVHIFYRQNIEALHGKRISLQEWREYMSEDAKNGDEEHYLICHGAMPMGWMKLNGLLNSSDDTAWISMLAVDPKFHGKGVGTFAVKFAEEYLKSKGFKNIGIHTTDDNIPAQNLYKKCGFEITEHGECTTGDGEKRMGYTFMKNIIY